MILYDHKYSVYPGFAEADSFGDAIVGSHYALADAAVVTFIFGWLYNQIAGTKKRASHQNLTKRP